jgi:hypothetical protein
VEAAIRTGLETSALLIVKWFFSGSSEQRWLLLCPTQNFKAISILLLFRRLLRNRLVDLPGWGGVPTLLKYGCQLWSDCGKALLTLQLALVKQFRILMTLPTCSKASR